MVKKAKGERSKVLPEDATGRLRRCVGEGAVEREREEGQCGRAISWRLSVHISQLSQAGGSLTSQLSGANDARQGAPRRCGSC